MRIAFSGTGNSGKTTLVKSFLYTWGNYITPERTYRDVIEEDKLSHSSNTTTDTQEKILSFMIDQIQSYNQSDKVVYDRCPLDNIAYSMWCHEKGIDGFTKDFVTEQIKLMKESMRFIDIIFLCRFDVKQKIEDDGFRDTDINFIKEVDNIFYSLYKQYTEHPEADIFFPQGDSPCIIMLPDNSQARIDLVAEYVSPDGDMYGDEDSILNPENINELERLVEIQKKVKDQEDEEERLKQKFGLRPGGELGGGSDYPSITL
jgi:predicted ATPase|tara:strand:- start:12082 stop:12861 length:780 start_codon:yes stop_codon:yes gene_type:complete